MPDGAHSHPLPLLPAEALTQHSNATSTQCTSSSTTIEPLSSNSCDVSKQHGTPVYKI